MATVTTSTKFGVPTAEGAVSGILMPKLKYRFRVTTDGFGGDGLDYTRQFTQNVQSVTRPKLTYEEVIIDSYNSRVYLQGKHSWEQISITLRDTTDNTVAREVGAQLQKQFDHLQQQAPAAATDYKFRMKIEVLDGSHTGVSEEWALEGCFLTNVDYSDHDYATNDPVQITLQIRYDSAEQVYRNAAEVAGQ
jgi:hypothetical protein